MKIGWCAPLDDAALLRDLGYDFIETAPETCLAGDRT
jgi:hypothetical protein